MYLVNFETTSIHFVYDYARHNNQCISRLSACIIWITCMKISSDIESQVYHMKVLSTKHFAM